MLHFKGSQRVTNTHCQDPQRSGPAKSSAGISAFPLSPRKSTTLLPHLKATLPAEDGTKLYFERIGKPKGTAKKSDPLIVFCYGLVCSHRLWEPQLNYFSKKHRVFWMDYRGHHQSERPKKSNTLSLFQFARDLDQVLTHLKEPEIILVGHSLGSSVALEYYSQFPQRVKGMVLANGAIKRPLETLFDSNRLEKGIRFLLRAYERSPRLLEALYSLQLSAPVFSLITQDMIRRKGFNVSLSSRKDLEAILRAFAKIHPEVLVRLLLDFHDRDDSHWVHKINVPTLVVAGAKDCIVPPRQQEELHQLIPHSEFDTFSHGHHCPQIDVAQAFNLRLELFFQRFFPSTK